MSYTPTVWNTGDVITAEKLNHAEQGIAANTIFHVVTFTQNGTAFTCDYTYEQIAALTSGGALLIGVATVGSRKVLLPEFGHGTDGEDEYFRFSTLTGDINGDKIGSLSAIELDVYENGNVNIEFADRSFT